MHPEGTRPDAFFFSCGRVRLATSLLLHIAGSNTTRQRLGSLLGTLPRLEPLNTDTPLKLLGSSREVMRAPPSPTKVMHDSTRCGVVGKVCLENVLPC